MQVPANRRCFPCAYGVLPCSFPLAGQFRPSIAMSDSDRNSSHSHGIVRISVVWKICAQQLSHICPAVGRYVLRFEIGSVMGIRVIRSQTTHRSIPSVVRFRLCFSRFPSNFIFSRCVSMRLRHGGRPADVRIEIYRPL